MGMLCRTPCAKKYQQSSPNRPASAVLCASSTSMAVRDCFCQGGRWFLPDSRPNITVQFSARLKQNICPIYQVSDIGGRADAPSPPYGHEHEEGDSFVSASYPHKNLSATSPETCICDFPGSEDL
ncbi:hypothetical protein HOLleu_15432 [Holothuria leucospilota]|uniref:Uncharacterized protein n=1 Tax=Holothuria leucospilota TaxID=206669 RepID=A0A9Q1C942_HOLLE|nr:hypothetical protein HOLleu_15432 [Holothuria leucospilota]